ncbi:CBS domain-containing protein [Flavobacteriaceae bacterium Ap0902]|nr:CBS domain-containing protein [Flavobacteriaceae bacterium Ap0902]
MYQEKYLNHIKPDNRTRLFENLPDRFIKNVINLLNNEEKEKAETLNFLYIVDDANRLIDDLKIGELLMAEPSIKIADLMDYHFNAIVATTPMEETFDIFDKYDRSTLPIVTENGMLVGIVTFDDIIDEITDRDTEDIHKFGGSEGLYLSYTQTPLLSLMRKRAGWLIILFFGNVMKKELLTGFMLGTILGAVGFLRILFWQQMNLYDYGEYWIFIGLTVGVSLIFIVLWGTLLGSLIPFILRTIGLDPATASASFVGTLVDVTGIIIYFVIAALFLADKLL